MRTLTVLLTLVALQAPAAELSVQVRNAPSSGQLVFQVYESADAFGDFRDPTSSQARASKGDGIYQVSDIPRKPFALLVFVDENDNGILDRNFVGIPKEPIGLSNNYRPKGPPSFEEARVIIEREDSDPIRVSLYQILGKRGQWGLGIGAIGQSSPYVGSDESVLQVVPAITYIGERLQWFGPSLRFGILGSDKVRLAVDLNYRIGAYDEDDSPILDGLGNRRDTLMGGLALQFELPRGLDLGVRYQHDVLDEIGGGSAQLSLSRDFQRGRVRFSPGIAVNWLSDDLSNHDFGVPGSASTLERPAYAVGDTVRFDASIQTLIEVSQNWRLVLNARAGILESDIQDSPIVAEEVLVSGFAALTYQF